MTDHQRGGAIIDLRCIAGGDASPILNKRGLQRGNAAQVVGEGLLVLVHDHRFAFLLNRDADDFF